MVEGLGLGGVEGDAMAFMAAPQSFGREVPNLVAEDSGGPEVEEGDGLICSWAVATLMVGRALAVGAEVDGAIFDRAIFGVDVEVADVMVAVVSCLCRLLDVLVMGRRR